VKPGSVVGGIVGLGLAVWLLHGYGAVPILALVGHAGWLGILAVIALHPVQMFYSALGWRAIAGTAGSRPGLRTYLMLRWIREGVNNLLPLMQIGGEIVVWRMLRRRGVQPAVAIAGTVADLALEMATQIAFTLLGLILLLRSVGNSGLAASVAGGLGVAALGVTALFGATWLGLATAIEKALLRFGQWVGWAGAASIEGLHEALLDCYREPGRVARAALWHLASWLLGGLEVCLALHFLGHGVGLAAGLVIESLGQAAKALGFAVPGAVGVQEGGYIVICRAFGVGPDVAIALSLMKRLREVALGIPALIVWQRSLTRNGAAPTDSVPGFLQ
jgi:putative membrane protein